MLKALASPALLLSLLFSSVCGAMADNVPRNVVTELAPTGKLRVAINFGNIVLAQKDPASGEPRGVSAELARELAKRLAVPIEFLTFDAAGKVFDALGKWDIAFLAIDPVRAAGIDFTALRDHRGRLRRAGGLLAQERRGRRPRRGARRGRARERL